MPPNLQIQKIQALNLLFQLISDDTPPKFLSCPADITAFTGEIISWVKPEAFDNVGVRRLIEPYTVNGTIVGTGIHVFTYTAIDWSGNTAQCSFSVEIKSRSEYDNTFCICHFCEKAFWFCFGFQYFFYFTNKTFLVIKKILCVLNHVYL